MDRPWSSAPRRSPRSRIASAFPSGWKTSGPSSTTRPASTSPCNGRPSLVWVDGERDLVDRLRGERQVLCIVNSRRHASDLFLRLDDPDALAPQRLDVRGAPCESRRRDPPPASPRGERALPGHLHPGDRGGRGRRFPRRLPRGGWAGLRRPGRGRCNREGRLVEADGNRALGRVFVFDYDAKSYPTSPMIQSGRRLFPRSRAGPHERPALAAGRRGFLPPALLAAGRGRRSRAGIRGGTSRSSWTAFASIAKFSFTPSSARPPQAYRLIDDAQTHLLVPYGKRGEKLDPCWNASPILPSPAAPARFDRDGAALRRRRLRARSQEAARTACSGSATGGTTLLITTRTTTSSGCDSMSWGWIRKGLCYEARSRFGNKRADPKVRPLCPA